MHRLLIQLMLVSIFRLLHLQEYKWLLIISRRTLE